MKQSLINRQRLRVILFALLALSAAACLPVPAHAQNSASCHPGTSDDSLRPLPRALVPQAIRLFGLHAMPAAQVQHSTVIRCMNGQLLACNYGANLPCGKANTSRSLPAADAWCQQNPNADFIPAYISGHDSIYNWRCTRGAPVAGNPAEPIDSRGFLSAYWKGIPQ